MKLLTDDQLGNARTSNARTARSRRTRTNLTAAVRDELRSTGAFTADTVAARADCSVATFYGHFATKDDALAAGFEVVLLEMLDLMREGINPDLLAHNLESNLVDFVDHQVAFFRQESLVFRAALARLPAHQTLRRLFREAERVSLLHLSDAFRAIGISSPEQTAEQFLVLSQGLNNPRVLRVEGGHLRDEFASALTNLIRRSDKR